MRHSELRAKRRIKPLNKTLSALLIGFILGLLVYPAIARAVTTQESGHYPQPSETLGYALEAHASIENEKDMSSLDRSRYTAAPTYESGAVSAIYTPQKAQNASQSEVEMLSYIRHRESSGNPTAQNPKSSAYGLYGFLDSTWETVGCVKTSDPKEQERCALLYMEQRYGGIEGAYYFHLKNDYY